jgi:HD-GYP domain-containing protein (c-di-GMP phosphodiesterase class II)
MKVTPLTAAEWAVMKTHAVKSERIIRAAEMEGGDLIGLVARHHHERFDGTGYPDGLAGDAIPILARILAVADAYDAMARTRVYRHALPHARIMRELHDAQGRQHDPYLFAKFAKLIEHSPFKGDATGDATLADAFTFGH